MNAFVRLDGLEYTVKQVSYIILPVRYILICYYYILPNDYTDELLVLDGILLIHVFNTLSEFVDFFLLKSSRDLARGFV